MGEVLELSEMVEVVACHGLNDGLEGHGSALGMGYGFRRRRGEHFLDEEQVPLAQCRESGKRLLGRKALIRDGPLFLVEWLQDVVVFG